VLGDTSTVHVRVSIDEHDIGRFQVGTPATAHARGDANRPLSLTFLRVVPFVEPKRMLTGQGDERVDTRVLQVIYSVAPPASKTPEAQLYIGQQVDVRIEPAARQADQAEDTTEDTTEDTAEGSSTPSTTAPRASNGRAST